MLKSKIKPGRFQNRCQNRRVFNVDSGAFLRRPRMRNRRWKEFQTLPLGPPPGSLLRSLTTRHDTTRNIPKKTVKNPAHADRLADLILQEIRPESSWIVASVRTHTNVYIHFQIYMTLVSVRTALWFDSCPSGLLLHDTCVSKRENSHGAKEH